jgi:hypothetical protein
MRIREVGSQFVLTPECGITSVTQRPSDVPHPSLGFLRQRRKCIPDIRNPYANIVVPRKQNPQ